MKSLFVLPFLLLFQVKCFYSTTYLSDNIDNYNTAMQTCQGFGGKLLEYGQQFLDTAVYCNKLSEYMWTGIPFFYWRHSDGCRNGQTNKRTPIDERQPDKHIAVCSDFCSDNENYTYVGVTDTECFCYDQDTYDSLAVPSQCQSPFCSTNQYDYCGISPDALVFRKIESFEIHECRARNVFGNTTASQFIGYCLVPLPYICRVGESNDIRCSFDELTATTEEMTSSQSQSSTINNDMSTLIMTDDTPREFSTSSAVTSTDSATTTTKTAVSTTDTIMSSAFTTHKSKTTADASTTYMAPSSTESQALTKFTDITTLDETSSSLQITSNGQTPGASTNYFTSLEDVSLSSSTTSGQESAGIASDDKSTEESSTNSNLAYSSNRISSQESMSTSKSQYRSSTSPKAMLTSNEIYDTISLGSMHSTMETAKATNVQTSTKTKPPESTLFPEITTKSEIPWTTTLQWESGSRQKDRQNLFVGIIAGSGGFMLSLVIVVILTKACCSRVRNEAKNKREMKQSKYETLIRNKSYIFKNRLLQGTHPFRDRLQMYGGELYSYDNLSHIGVWR